MMSSTTLRPRRDGRFFASRLFAGLLLVGAGAGPANAGPVTTNNVTAELVSERTSIRAGEALDVGITLRPVAGWHTYWMNPGHTGLPTRVKWNLPSGFRAGELEWPHPVRLGTAPFVTFGYEGDAMLLSRLETPPSLRSGDEVKLRAEVRWLACREDGCIPGKAELELELPVRDEAPARDPRWTSAFDDARSRLPRSIEGWSARLSENAGKVRIDLAMRGEARPSTTRIDVFPEVGKIIDVSAQATVVASSEGFTIEIAKEAAAVVPDVLDLVLVAEGGWDSEGRVQALAVEARKDGAAAGTGAAARPAVSAASAASASSAPSSAPSPLAPRSRTEAGSEPRSAAAPSTARITLLAALVSAFLGGLILNLMPCVFPVLSLKILGFVHVAHHDPARVRHHGYAFGAGVLVSFWILAGLLLALRAAGSFLGWGFQLQEPIFVACIAILLFAMALNLLAVFELGSSVVSVAGRFDSQTGLRGSFLSGVLATVLATPCSAPFMGSAVGFAVVQPTAVALAVFTSLGIGMALPYVVLACVPALMRRLPRPGPWMEIFREAMAFPLLATVAWLVWVFGQQTGNDGVLQLLLALLLVAIAAWLGGRMSTLATSATTRAVSRTLAALVLGTALIVTVSASSRANTDGTSSADNDPDSPVRWIAWDPDSIAGHRAAGRPVLVDFTAAWCLSCKVNERVALSSTDFADRLKDLDVVAMKADWTNGDPAITHALESFGRSGVPLYVVYPRDPVREPIVLPEILTPDIVHDALERAAHVGLASSN